MAPFRAREDAASALSPPPGAPGRGQGRAGIRVALMEWQPIPPETPMDSPLLRRLFSRALRASLASPLVLAGCGDGFGGFGGVDLTGYSAPACEGTVPAVSGLTPAAPVDL